MKLSDKLQKVNDNLTVYLYDNGFMVEISGRDHEDSWTGAKIVCESIDQVMELISEATTMERD
jgi:hypothetical protein